MAAIARASPHCRVQHDEMVAHYTRPVDRSPRVIRPFALPGPLVVELPRLASYDDVPPGRPLTPSRFERSPSGQTLELAGRGDRWGGVCCERGQRG